MLDAGCTADAWETTYQQVLTGADPVLDWVRGTALRPVAAALSAEDGHAFEAEYAVALRAAYPATAHGTVLAFRRIFAVAQKQPGA
ncbi:trans-aconitate 2-methyltransferase [Arthrobacter sp. Hiyo4]|nr:trans-aconitate 2-methyltransferase [Arthrobacter sp. Hiyo4]